jgi:hypothetical protein
MRGTRTINKFQRVSITYILKYHERYSCKTTERLVFTRKFSCLDIFFRNITPYFIFIFYINVLKIYFLKVTRKALGNSNLKCKTINMNAHHDNNYVIVNY